MAMQQPVAKTDASHSISTLLADLVRLRLLLLVRLLLLLLLLGRPLSPSHGCQHIALGHDATGP